MSDKRREQAAQRQARASDGRFLPSPGKKTVAVRVYGAEEDLDWFASLPSPAARGMVVRVAKGMVEYDYKGEVVGDE